MPDVEKERQSTAAEKGGSKPSGFKSFFRLSEYADRTAWTPYSVAFVAAAAAGAALPLMDLLFGKFVTTFNNFAIGIVDSNEYMRLVSKYA
jgi:ATP-binding cassette, subfamily B (MDR/TAP), member 1